MQLSKPQARVARDNHRFKVVIAGRRWGKTYLAIRDICYHARIPNRNIFYITSSYRAAKMIVWEPLKTKLFDLKWAEKVNESELSIRLKNGSTIALKGAENPDSLRGVSLDYVVIDEVAEINESLWTEVIRPALADKQGGALFIGTPKGKGNWSYELYQMPQYQPGVWQSWQFTTASGGRVSNDEIEQAKRDMSEKQFRQEFHATFETFEGRVAHAFEREHNVVDVNEVLDHVDTSTLYVGCDFNVNPVTAAVCILAGDEMYVIDEVVIHNSNTQELADELKNRYPNSKIFVYPDPSGNQRKTSANGATDHTILQNSGFIVKAPRKHDAVRDRINAINARFANSQGKRQLFVDKTCKYTIESMEKYTYKEGTQTPDKNSGYDHIFDALSYCVAYLYPLKKNTSTEDKPKRWTHKLA